VAFQDMVSELYGCVPKIPRAYCSTLVNRAWRNVRESNLWSFNLFEASWISPPPITENGTVTTTQGFPAITFDSVATAALNAFQIANPYVLITQLQFRQNFSGGIYNIIQYNPVTGAALLDRPYADVSGTGQAFFVYQVYYTAPMADFLTFQSVTNPQMYISLDLTKTRAWLDDRDPQRAWSEYPTCVVPLGMDTRGAGTANASATLGWPMFELWGQPLSPYTYQLYGLRRGTDLVNPTDTLPSQIPEELVMARARVDAYEWAEANKDMSPRSSGPDFRFLIGRAMDDFKQLMIRYRKQDKEFVDNWFSIHELNGGVYRTLYFNTLAGVASPGGSSQFA
jgi:hypothetical protein